MNMLAVLETIDDCLARKRFLSSLVLLYSMIDVVAGLESGEHTRLAFMRWTDQYVLNRASASIRCSASDLYAARCSILHSFSAKPDVSKDHKAIEVSYAYGSEAAYNKFVSKLKLPPGQVVIHLDGFIKAFRGGLQDYFREIQRDRKRWNRSTENINVEFTNIEES